MVLSARYVSAWAALLGVGLLLGPRTVVAQDTDAGGLRLGLRFSEQFRSSNDGTFARTDLGFKMLSETRRQNFTLDLSTGFEAGSKSGAVDQRFDAEYGLENRQTVLSFSANFRRSDLDTLTLTDTLDGSALVLDTGKRQDMSLALDLAFGRENPFGAGFTLAHTETRYIDTLSTALVDSKTDGAVLTLRFNLSKTATAYARLSANHLDRATGSDVRRTSLGASLDLEIMEDWIATFDLGTTRVEQDTGFFTVTQEGFYYGASIVVPRTNGNLSLLLDSQISETGRRSTLKFNRQFELPRGAVNIGTGLSRNSAEGKTDSLYSLGFLQNLQRTQLRADFTQTFSITSTGVETLESRLSFGLQHELGALANLRVALALRDSNQLVVGGLDAQQFDISVDYAHQVTADWDMFAGISHSLRRADGQADQTEDTVFFGIRRDFEWRP